MAAVPVYIICCGCSAVRKAWQRGACSSDFSELIKGCLVTSSGSFSVSCCCLSTQHQNFCADLLPVLWKLDIQLLSVNGVCMFSDSPVLKSHSVKEFLLSVSLLFCHMYCFAFVQNKIRIDDYSSELLGKVNVKEMEDDKDGSHLKRKSFSKES